jgi:hypothetical protein
MPDVDVFSRYIRGSANELEALIAKASKKKTAADKKSAKEKSKSTPFFKALKRYYIKETALAKKYTGSYHINVDMGVTAECWEINVAEDTVSIKKTKNLDPATLIEVEDANLYALYKGTLLFDELKIQQRIVMTGSVTNKNKFTNLLKAFLEK